MHPRLVAKFFEHSRYVLKGDRIESLTLVSLRAKRYYSGPGAPPGSGAGRGGGGGGAVKEGGGGLGRYGAAQEEGYFYNKTRDKLRKMKEDLGKSGSERGKDNSTGQGNENSKWK